MTIKGYTVHWAFAAGDTRAACGVRPKTFMGKPALTQDFRRVTCRACERFAALDQMADAPAVVEVAK